MGHDPSVPRQRTGRSCRLIAAVAFATFGVAACATDGPRVAVGADLDRPATPSMDLVSFDDVATEVGLGFRHGAFQWETGPDPMAMMGGGVCWIDYDRDGWLDLYAMNTWSNGEWGRWRDEGALPMSRLYRNDAGRFVDVTEATSAGVETRGNGCVAADLDLDGWTDLYLTTERANVLLWNDSGDGFIDDAESEEPSGTAAFGWHSGASVGDVDGNGWPDLFVAGYTDLNRPITSATKGFPNTHHPEPDLLFLNLGRSGDTRARFREVAGDVGIEPDGPDYGLGSVLSDLDADGDLDLYVANDTTPNQLYENVPGAGGEGFRFVEKGVETGVGDTGAGMGVAAADMDGDGLADLVTTNQLEERHVIVRNASNEGLAFVEDLPIAGLPEFGVGSTGWGTTWIDVDLDTDLDLFVGHGAIPVRDLINDRQLSQLIENLAPQGPHEGFADVTAQVGLVAVGPQLGRGVAAADFDNDGDIDLAMGTIGGHIVLLRNSGAGGTWLEVATPAPSPGTIVTVELADGTRMRRELVVGGSYLSSEDPRAHFGLGGADRADTVTIEWPDGTIVRRSDVEADQILRVERGDAE